MTLYSSMTLTYSEFRDLLSLCKPLLHLASAFCWRKAEFAPALLKQGHCAGSTLLTEGRRQCAGQGERYWDSVSIVQCPVSLKLIHVCDSAVLWVHAISVCFGSVSFATSGRLRNRWLGKTCVTGVFFCWVQWTSSDADLLTCKRLAVSRQSVWIDMEQMIPLLVNVVGWIGNCSWEQFLPL